MSKPIWNMPGPGGSLGLCAVCGNTFAAEILLGMQVHIVGLTGLEKDFCVHDECQSVIDKVQESKDWRDLPVGPLRKMFEEHYVAPPERVPIERRESGAG